MRRALRGLAVLGCWLSCPSNLAFAQKAAVSGVQVSSPRVSHVGVVTPGVTKLTVTSPIVAPTKVTSPAVSSPKWAKMVVAPVPVPKLGFEGIGSGGGPGKPVEQLDPTEQQIVDAASKDDLSWQRPDQDAHANLNNEARAETDAASKAYQGATAAGMDKNEAQRVAQAARQQVANNPNGAPDAGAPRVEPAAAPTGPDREKLPEVIDLSAKPANDPAAGAVQDVPVEPAP